MFCFPWTSEVTQPRRLAVSPYRAGRRPELLFLITSFLYHAAIGSERVMTRCRHRTINSPAEKQVDAA